MPASDAQKTRIRAFNVQLIAHAANVPPAQVTGNRKLGALPPVTALGIARMTFMATRSSLNTELANPFYQPSTSVSSPEYGALYDGGGTVNDYHQMTFAHIAVGGGAVKKAAAPAKKAAAAPKKAAAKAKKAAPKAKKAKKTR